MSVTARVLLPSLTRLVGQSSCGGQATWYVGQHILIFQKYTANKAITTRRSKGELVLVTAVRCVRCDMLLTIFG